ncbi:hypothetical protein E2C01_015555 [Portunus trituberculatus]|uniref:Uncharacterized protein n=1 Tax=Portunus trituberculatus TaxID=210409 RepID=A0A5B7DM79_PORTR|nr:hypothetical protein [Portunus trituberculatus]
MLHTATMAVTVCSVVNIVAASLITLVLREHTRFLQFRNLNANVEAKGQSEDITDSHKAAPNDPLPDPSTVLPDASTDERDSGNSSAFDPVVVLKMMTLDSLSPSFTSVDSQHSVQVGDFSDPTESPSVPADSSAQSPLPPTTPHHAPRYKTKRSLKLAANNKHQREEKSSKHGASKRQRAINESEVIHDAPRLQKPRRRA